MTAEPGNEMAAAAAGRGHLRASHADREQVIAMLKAAFVQGRLTKDELDARVGQTFAARTDADLAALTADLPAGLARARQSRQPAPPPAGSPANKTVLLGAGVLIPSTVLAAAFLTGSGGVFKLFLLVIPWFFIVWIVAGLQALDSWQKRSRGQLPPRPVQRGHAVERGQNRGRGDDLVLCGACSVVRARHLPEHGVIQRILWSLPVRRDLRGPADLHVTT